MSHRTARAPRTSGTRKVVVDGLADRYTRRHTHVEEPEGRRVCQELLCIWPEDRRHAAWVLRFRACPDGATTAGEGWGGHDGGVMVDGESVNLNLPSVIAALLRAARGLGPSPERRPLELDGFALWRRSHILNVT